MFTEKDERGFSQGFKITKVSKIRQERRFDYMINQMDRNKFNTGANVLEMGCATGEALAYLVRKTGMNGLGIDLSKKFIDVANSEYSNNNLSFSIIDFNDEKTFTKDFSYNKFDYIIGNGILHHLYHSIDNSLSNIYKLLKPNGKIIFLEPNIYNPYIALIFNIPFLRKKAGLEPDEMAFSDKFIKGKLKGAGFINVRTEIRDFLLPNTPEKLVKPVIKLGDILEKTSLTYIAQSIFIVAEKPMDL